MLNFFFPVKNIIMLNFFCLFFSGETTTDQPSPSPTPTLLQHDQKQVGAATSVSGDGESPPIPRNSVKTTTLKMAVRQRLTTTKLLRWPLQPRPEEARRRLLLEPEMAGPDPEITIILLVPRHSNNVNKKPRAGVAKRKKPTLPW